MSDAPRAAAGLVGRIVMGLVMTALAFVFVEGLSSALLGTLGVLRTPPLREASRYDPNLGWTGLADSYFPEMYGEGNDVSSNARGFRGRAETDVAVAPGRSRVICSGDSFTYGQGVADDETWCHLLSTLDPSRESVNLGLPGYGVDQMYLRYLEQGLELEHDVHIVAFVDGDFERMAYRDKNGYGKPVLRIDDGALVVDNVPVPRLRWSFGRAVERADLRSIELGRRVLGRLAGGEALDSHELAAPLAERAFTTLAGLGDERGVESLFVYLPAPSDLAEERPWRIWVRDELKTLGLPLLDLTPALRELPAQRAVSFFIPPGSDFAGHYTEAGNEWVARQLHAALVADSQAYSSP